MPWEWLKSFFTEKPTSATIKEGYGKTIDSTLDEIGFRRISSREENSLQIREHAHERMQKIAIHLWESNLLANRLIELPISYLLGEGVQMTCDNEADQQILQDFWDDPINDLSNSLEEIIRATHLSGMMCLPLFVNEFNGKVKIGYLNPRNIQEPIFDPENPRVCIGVTTKIDVNGQSKKYKTIFDATDDELFTKKTQLLREQFTDGFCLYLRINNLPDDVRGRSDLLTSADWVDGLDEFLWGELDRQHFLRAYVWDVEILNGTPEEVENRAREIKPPKPGSVRVHNSNEKWSAVSPDIRANDTSGAAKLFKNHVLGGATIPEHWFGSGGEVNRATASEMSDPAFKTLTMRQRKWRHVLEKLGRFVLRQNRMAFGKDENDLPKIYAQFPDLVQKDLSKYASAFQQVVTTTMLAVQNGQISEETALQLISRVSGALGVDFDTTAELEKLLKKKEEKEHADANPLGFLEEEGDGDAYA